MVHMLTSKIHCEAHQVSSTGENAMGLGEVNSCLQVPVCASKALSDTTTNGLI